ncbi:protein SGT1 homolog [Rhincodon typus]|uniref:protein SGT1 homolog n=1 Tax=Rhincodon typus TaxID=259920 RepID=UPI00202EC3EF|nr:protein SGT1 homolog [Rhincodon typus]
MATLQYVQRDRVRKAPCMLATSSTTRKNNALKEKKCIVSVRLLSYTVYDPYFALFFQELTAAVEQDLDKAEYYCQRAYAHILLKNYKEVVEDANKALKLKPNCALAYLRKGIAEYHLKMYQSSMESFRRGQELDGDNPSFSTWIKTCEETLKSAVSSEEVSMDLKHQLCILSTAAGQQDGKAEEICTQQKAVPKVKHDWYQTDSHVIITIMIKNASKDAVNVEFSERSVSATVKLSPENDYNLKLSLLHPIVPQYCTVKVLGTKIEIKLKKTEAIRWEKLEGFVPDVKHFVPVQPQRYPSSSHCTKNWDKLVMEIKQEENDEKPEGDAALNQLFQKIYADGSDEVKRAMNKSFTESGGTVLSTNWSEVGKKTVAVNPPDDMEWKKL